MVSAMRMQCQLQETKKQMIYPTLSVVMLGSNFFLSTATYLCSLSSSSAASCMSWRRNNRQRKPSSLRPRSDLSSDTQSYWNPNSAAWTDTLTINSEEHCIQTILLLLWKQQKRWYEVIIQCNFINRDQYVTKLSPCKMLIWEKTTSE